MTDLALEALRRIAKARQALAAASVGAQSAPVNTGLAERVAAAKAGTLKLSPEREAAQRAIDQPIQDQLTLEGAGMGLARAQKVIQGIPFLGQYFDEITPRPDQTRAINDAMDRLHPVQSTALQIGGGVLGSIPAAVAAGPSLIASAPAGLAQRVAAGAATGAVLGGAEGAVSGYGRGTGEDRASTAINDAKMGTAFGAVAGGAAPIMGAGIQKIAEWIKRSDVGIIAKTFGISRDAAKALKPDFEALDPTAAARNLRVAGPNAMVADAGIPTREALDTAITGGGKAARVGVDAVSGRAAATGGKLGQVLDTVLGLPEGVKSAAKGIAQRTAPARQKAYEMAYGTAINYADDTGRAIEDVLGRIPPKTLNAAISEANDAMRAAGIKNQQIMAEIAADGSVSFREMPNVQQLDEIKKALGTIANGETDAVTGRITAAGMRANKLAADLKAAVGNAVPSYGTAVKLGGDKIAEDRALDIGRKLFSPSVTRETVAATMDGASIEAKDAARRGIRSYIDDALARVRRSIDEPGADTTETLRLLNTLSTRDAREKLVSVLGAAKTDRLLAEIDAAGKQFATRAAIATGSATGRRSARSAALDAALAPGVVGNAAKGKPAGTFQAAVQFLTRATPEADMAQRQAVLADMAKALTSMRGPQAEQALATVQAAIAGQPIKSAEAVRIARLLAGTGAIGIYQTGKQLTTK